jgi:hypothetical protein
VLIALASVKGAPGVTSTALALAALWPRPVVLLEADTAGGDLAYRCRAAHGGPVYSDRGVVKLAAASRTGSFDSHTVSSQAQMLACGVRLVQGVESAAQARSIAGLWPTIAEACQVAEVDVIMDLGRLERSSPVMPLAQAADWFLPVAAASLESLMHLVDGLQDVAAGLGSAAGGVVRMLPLLVGPDGTASADTADLDGLLGRLGLPVGRTQPVPVDARTVMRLEQGERATGRLGRTLLVRGCRLVVNQMAPAEVGR